ncbi:MAG TPA: UDP-3-O-(3-hydroxymyristoyl)glucosamine N-acyltransferase [Burkholderiaceae bacterium]|nr:UDP-3-O-(3-hydroxymyristoyl)glucosamine N-acyltransferase [Burkholderiaceae bacterium]
MASARTVSELCDAVARLTEGQLTARIIGDAGLRVEAVASLETAGAGHLAFLSNARYRQQARHTAAGALVLADADCRELFPEGRTQGTLIVCDTPYAWYAFAAQELSAPEAFVAERAASAIIDSSARVHPQARVDALAVIEEAATVEAGAWIGPGCVLGGGVHIGAGTRLHGGVRVYRGCRIGQRGIIHSGAVIGADGFGFAPFRGRWVKIPQLGIVRIGDDVEIGANTTIDRGSAGDTVVGDGVKIDNQVQIGHNCRIGAHTAIAGCVGVAGSTIIGRGCQIGGAAMIQGHITIADGTVISGGTVVTHSLHRPDFYTAIFPLMRNRDWERNAALTRHLVEMRERIRRLEGARSGSAGGAVPGADTISTDNKTEPTP